jgi:hypothetical protein
MSSSRRTFIKEMGLASAALDPTVNFLATTFGIRPLYAASAISFQFHLFRPQDLLDLEYSFINLTPDVSDLHNVRYLYPTDRRAPKQAYMIIRFPQLHVAEQFFYLRDQQYPSDFNQLVRHVVAKSFVSGFSFAAFAIHFRDPAGLPFSGAPLLDWNSHFFSMLSGEAVTSDVSGLLTQYPLVLKQGKPYPFVLKADSAGNQIPFSAFELPYKLYLTPYLGKSSEIDFGSNDLRLTGPIADLWSNHLVTKNAHLPPSSYKVVGSQLANGDFGSPIEYLPNESNRLQLVKQFLRERGHVTNVKDFRLTGLGATTNLRYYENPKLFQNCDIIEWKQDIAVARDNEVEIVIEGCLMPFGHKCKLIRVGHRRIKAGVSFMEFKEYILPLESSKTYFTPPPAGASNQNAPVMPSLNGDPLAIKQVRNTPFQSIEILNKVPQPIIPVETMTNEIVVGSLNYPACVTFDDPSNPNPVPGQWQMIGAFWPKVSNEVSQAGSASPIAELLHFDFLATDWNGNAVSFKAPFIFVSDFLFGQGLETKLSSAVQAYEATANLNRRQLNTSNQTISFYRDNFTRTLDNKAQAFKTKMADLETMTIEFITYHYTKYSFSYEFPFYPQLNAAFVQLPVIKEVLQNTIQTAMSYAPAYLTSGIEDISPTTTMNKLDNMEGMLLSASQELTQPLFGNIANQLAGIIYPQVVIQGLSLYQQAYGLDSGYAKILPNDLNNTRILADTYLAQIFSGADLFGCIPLADLLNPNLPIRELPIAAITALANGQVELSYNWTSSTANYPFLQNPQYAVPGGEIKVTFLTSQTTALSLQFTADYNSAGNTANAQALTEINSFGIGLYLADISEDLVEIDFDSISFSASSGSKPSVNVSISQVKFKGMLLLLEQIESILNTLGKGLSFSIGTADIEVSYSFALPEISVGAFNLINVATEFDFILPYESVPNDATNQPISFGFALSSKEAPFILSISIFGGTGYFGMTVSARGVEDIEALLGFGGYLGFDMAGIASGTLTLMAGIYYQKVGRNSATLTGWITASGSLNVADVVTVSVIFTISLTYYGNGVLSGSASVTVNVSVLGVGVSYTLTLGKTVTNGGIADLQANALALQVSESDGSDESDDAGNCVRPLAPVDECLYISTLNQRDKVMAYSAAFN